MTPSPFLFFFPSLEKHPLLLGVPGDTPKERDLLTACGEGLAGTKTGK